MEEDDRFHDAAVDERQLLLQPAASCSSLQDGPSIQDHGDSSLPAAHPFEQHRRSKGTESAHHHQGHADITVTAAQFTSQLPPGVTPFCVGSSGTSGGLFSSGGSAEGWRLNLFDEEDAVTLSNVLNIDPNKLRSAFSIPSHSGGGEVGSPQHSPVHQDAGQGMGEGNSAVRQRVASPCAGGGGEDHHERASGVSGVPSLMVSGEPRQSGLSSTNNGSVVWEGRASRAESTGPRMKRRRVRFADAVDSVAVYEAEESLLVKVKYTRHTVGWVCLVLTVLSSAVFWLAVQSSMALRPSCHDAIMVWIAVGDLVTLVVVLLGSVQFTDWDQFTPEKREYVFSRRGVGWLLFLSLLHTMFQTAQQVVIQALGEVHFFSSSASPTIWIILHRALFGRARVLKMEIFGAAITVVGYALCAIQNEIMMGMVASLLTNGISLLLGGCAAAFFLQGAYVLTKTPVVLVLVALRLCSFPVQLQMGLVNHYPVGCPELVFFEPGFTWRWIVVAVSNTVLTLSTLTSLVYLDPVSVSSSFTISYVIVLCFAHMWWPQELNTIGWKVVVGGVLVLAGGILLAYIGSVRRSIVMYTLHFEGKRKKRPKNPYRRSSGEPKRHVDGDARPRAEALLRT